MKSNWFRLVICVVSRLGLLNFAFSVVSSCRIYGPNVFQVGDQLSLECVSTNGHQTAFTSMDSRAHKTSNGGYANLTIDSVTLDDSMMYRCKCSTTNEHYDDHDDHYVLVVEANMYAVTNNVNSCEVAVMLMVTSKLDRFNVSSFSCPTLGRGNPSVWKFSRATNSHGYHVMHIFAVGESGGENLTCDFTVGYYPNGAHFAGNFSKTVGGTGCSKRIGPVATKHTGDDVPVTSKPGKGASRDAQHTLLLTALILLCHSAKYHFSC